MAFANNPISRYEFIGIYSMTMFQGKGGYAC